MPPDEDSKMPAPFADSVVPVLMFVAFLIAAKLGLDEQKNKYLAPALLAISTSAAGKLWSLYRKYKKLSVIAETKLPGVTSRTTAITGTVTVDDLSKPAEPAVTIQVDYTPPVTPKPKDTP